MIGSGRGFTEADEQSAALVVVIGNTVAQQIFGGDEDPVGASILVKGFPLRVIGVLATKGQSGWGQDQDDLVMIPFALLGFAVLSFVFSFRFGSRFMFTFGSQFRFTDHASSFATFA